MGILKRKIVVSLRAATDLHKTGNDRTCFSPYAQDSKEYFKFLFASFRFLGICRGTSEVGKESSVRICVYLKLLGLGGRGCHREAKQTGCILKRNAITAASHPSPISAC